MDVVLHEDKAIELEVVTLFVVGEECKIFLKVRYVSKDLLLLVAARDNVEEGSFVFYPGLACHAAIITEPESPVKNSIFKSDPNSGLFCLAGPCPKMVYIKTCRKMVQYES